jgi:hypothetical protein
VAAATAELVRKAENSVRRELGLPLVGEGWLSETQLYWEIRNEFAEMAVEREATPSWLAPQRLDIYLPELGVAIEYQGEQHRQPVERFGGEEGFQRTVERDDRKRQLCEAHGIRLIYVMPGYCLPGVLSEIRDAAAPR